MRIKYKPVICCDGDEDEDVFNTHKPRHYSAQNIVLKHLTLISVLFSVIVFVLLYSGGLLVYVAEVDFSRYSYPLKIDRFKEFIQKLDENIHKDQSENNWLGINSINYNSINASVLSLGREHPQWRNITPLTQFREFEYTLNAQPTCRKLWGAAQLRDVLLSASSQNQISVVIIVKSAVNHYANRNAIRNSWLLNGTHDLFVFRTVFMVSKCHARNVVPQSLEGAQAAKCNKTSYVDWSPQDCEASIQAEATEFGDIIQTSAIDAYYNNTLKTFMTLQWLATQCPSDLVLAIDDDYVFEVDNFIDHLYSLATEYLPSHQSANQRFNYANSSHKQESAALHMDLQHEGSESSKLNQMIELNDTKSIVGDTQPSGKRYTADTRAAQLRALHLLSRQYIYRGYLRNYVRPLRFVYSKWYISKTQYPYNKYPPFITGGAILMSHKTVRHLYMAAHFAPAFKFDDVYLGMLAYKVGIVPHHVEEFMCTLDEYMALQPIRPEATRCIGVHDIEPADLLQLWHLRRAQESDEIKRERLPPQSHRR